MGTSEPQGCGGVDGALPAKIRRFEDLRIWQLAREIARGVYRAAETQRLGQDYAMLGQMKRAAISISSNIAEGYERGTRRQQIEACYIAKGSAGELRSQVIVAHDVGLLDETSFQWLLDHCAQCSRQLGGYLTHLRRTHASIRGAKYAKDAGCTSSPAEVDSASPSHFPTFPPSHVR
jgi:four helix bundle protein